MNILLVTYDFHPSIGGQGVATSGLVKTMTESKIKPFVLSPMTIGIQKPKNNFDYLKFNLIINIFLNQVLKKLHPEIIQFNGGPGGVLLFVKPSNKCKTVVLAHHTYMQQMTWGKGLVRGLMYRFVKFFEKRMYRMVNKIICVSNDTRQSLLDNYNIRKEKTMVIPVGIDETKFAPGTGKRQHSTLLFVGRLHWRKDPITLIRAFDKIQEEFPQAQLLIVGMGSLKNEIERFVKLRKLNNIHLLGYVSEEKLVQLYHTATVMVIPSQFEGLGIVGIEALAIGIPVVASNAVGLREVISHEETGLVFQVGNHDDLAEKLRRILLDDKLREQLSEKTPLIARQKYAWSRILRKFITAYECLLGSEI